MSRPPLMKKGSPSGARAVTAWPFWAHADEEVGEYGGHVEAPVDEEGQSLRRAGGHGMATSEPPQMKV
jgi:hypothetical protein